jgi:hypothetical protein
MMTSYASPTVQTRSDEATVDLWVLRTFIDQATPHSGALSGAILRSPEAVGNQRQHLSTKAGLPEVVYIDDPVLGIAQVFTPSRQRPFAGYPVIAAAWLLHERGFPVDTMRLSAGEVPVWRSDSGEMAMRMPAGWLTPQRFVRHDSLEELHAFRVGRDRVVRWAWVPGEERTVSAVFTIPDHPPGAGVSAGIAASLAATIGEPLTIRQGNGSLCRVVPIPGGDVNVRGRVALERVDRISWPPLTSDLGAD